MNKQLYWDILDQKRISLLPLLKTFREDFYLAGGTALALQLGHRDSVDFDFFSLQSFSTDKLSQKIEQVFKGHAVVKTLAAQDSLTFVVDDSIKISFFTYPYKLIKPLLDENNLMMASIEDIGAMKLSAITSQSVLKDYIDLYFIFHRISLAKLLEITKQKFPTIDVNTVLKSLVYFEDITEEPVFFKHSSDVDFASIRTYLSATIKNYLAEINKH